MEDKQRYLIPPSIKDDTLWAGFSWKAILAIAADILLVAMPLITSAADFAGILRAAVIPVVHITLVKRFALAPGDLKTSIFMGLKTAILYFLSLQAYVMQSNVGRPAAEQEDESVVIAASSVPSSLAKERETQTV